MGEDRMLDGMKQILKDNDMCVLATCSDNRPHCSLMAYITDDACETVYMATLKTTRKYGNILANPYVSLLVDTRAAAGSTRNRIKALTVSGVFIPIDDPAEKTALFARLLEAHPHLENLVSQPDAELLTVRARSFLLMDGVLSGQFENLESTDTVGRPF